MPVVRMPDGKLVRFPDEMSREEIKAFVAQKYPDAYNTESSFDWSKVTPEMRERIAANNRDYDNQSYAGRIAKDAITGYAEGLENLTNRAVNGATLGGFDWLDRHGGGEAAKLRQNIHQNVNDEVGTVGNVILGAGELGSEIAGNVYGAGGAITKGVMKGTAALSKAGVPVVSKVAGGTVAPMIADASIQGSIYGATESDSLDEVAGNAARGAAGGAVTSVALGGVVKALGRFGGLFRKDPQKGMDYLRKQLGDDAVDALIQEAKDKNLSILEVVDEKGLDIAQMARQQTPEAKYTIAKNLREMDSRNTQNTQKFFDDMFGQHSGYETVDDIAQAAKQEAQPLYNELESMGDLAAYEKNRNYDNFLLKNEAKYNNIANKGDENVFRQIRENGERGQVQLQSNPTATGTNLSGEAEKSAALRELVKFGQDSEGTSRNGLFISRDDGVGKSFMVNPEVSGLFEKANASQISYKQLNQTPKDSRRFFNAIKQAKNDLGDLGEQVWLYSPKEYQNMKLFLAEDGLSGIAVKPDGDIVSVFANPNAKLSDFIGSRSIGMVELAKQNGGTKLDAFDTFLPKLYARHGFKEIGRDAWNPEIAATDLKNWNKEYFKKWNNGEPDVVYMQLEKPQSPLANLVKENDVIADTIGKVKRSLSSLKKASDTDARVILETRKVLSKQTKSSDPSVAYQARNALKELDPVLKDVFGGKLEQANKIYEDAYKFQDAFDFGKNKVINRETSPQVFAREFDKLTDKEKKAVELGLKEKMLQITQGQTQESGWKLTPFAQQKIRRVLGEKEGGRLIDYANARIKAAQNRNAARGGSTTAQNQKMRDDVNFTVDALSNPTGIIGKALKRVPWNDARNRGIADILTNPDIGYVEAFYQNSRNPQGWEAVYEALMNPNSRQAKYNAALSAYLTGQALKD